MILEGWADSREFTVESAPYYSLSYSRHSNVINTLNSRKYAVGILFECKH